MQTYLTTRVYNLLDLCRKGFHGVTWDEPCYLVGYPQPLEKPQQPQSSDFASEDTGRVVSHVVVWVLARAKMGRDGVKVDG